MNRRIFNALSVASIVAVAGVLFGCSGQGSPAQKAGASAAGSADAPKVAGVSREGGRIVVGLEDNFAPMEFRDKNGALVGYDIDLANEVFKRANLPFEHKSINWDKKEDFLLKDKSIDIIWSAMTVTEERKRIFGLSTPYFKSRQVIIVPINSSINEKNDLGGKTVIIQSGGFVQEALKNFSGTNGAIAKLVEAPELTVALTNLLENKGDAVIGEEMVVNYYISRSPGKFRILKEDFGENDIAIGFRPGDTELISKINQALDSVRKDGTEQVIYKKWFGDAVAQ
ncbi:MAG: transporter substrate-binding domain-containing protein [Brachymonas sp.]|nr:transporter substrate-binding domain-containing protein [Brachymonas sp.]